jgi:hypothetical protein
LDFRGRVFEQPVARMRAGLGGFGCHFTVNPTRNSMPLIGLTCPRESGSSHWPVPSLEGGMSHAARAPHSMIANGDNRGGGKVLGGDPFRSRLRKRRRRGRWNTIRASRGVEAFDLQARVRHRPEAAARTKSTPSGERWQPGGRGRPASPPARARRPVRTFRWLFGAPESLPVLPGSPRQGRYPDRWVFSESPATTGIG